MSKFLNLVLILLLTGLFITSDISMAGDQALKQISEEIFQDTQNDKMWQMQKSKRLKSASSVEQYLSELNQGKYKDWRLPTKEELYTLFTYFDLKESGDVHIQLDGNYWIENEGIQAGAWENGDQCGPSRTYYRKKSGYIRAIRP
jgi:hypothetical protein